MQRTIQICDRFYNYYSLISEIYKHITYIGTITSSFMIYVLLQYFNQCGSNVHVAIHYLALFKSFLLYDSSYLELLHHYIQYYCIRLLFNPNIKHCSVDTIKSMKTAYCLLFTHIFNNIKIYIPRKHKKIRVGLDVLTLITFFYYRTQFNYYYWIGDGFYGIDSYININNNIKNKITASIISHVIFNIFCLLNVYWGYKIINILKYKMYNIIKDE